MNTDTNVSSTSSAASTEGRVQRALDDFRAGRMVILVDDEERENEGDLCLPAQFATPEAINFMAKHARGLICLSLTPEHVDRLELPLMTQGMHSERKTAFTVSVEAKAGVSTGISAADRAHTVRTVANPSTTAADIVSPGHIFPLRAVAGGVLQRSGHTEGSVDLARLAGLNPAAVICEIMCDDGSMARRPELEHFAREHQLHLLSIADLVHYRLQCESLIERCQTHDVTLRTGHSWTLHTYRVKSDGRHLLALTHGTLKRSPTLVRVHTQSLLGDVFGINTLSPSEFMLHEAINAIEEDGSGVILYLPSHTPFANAIGATSQTKVSESAQESADTLREYGIGAHTLADLGLHEIRVMTHKPRPLPNLEAYGLRVVEQCTGTS